MEEHERVELERNDSARNVLACSRWPTSEWIAGSYLFWEHLPVYRPLGAEVEAWLGEQDRVARAKRLIFGMYEAMDRDPLLVEQLKAATRLKEELLSGERKSKPPAKSRPVRGSRSPQVRGTRLKAHILATLREVKGPMLVRDIVGVIEDRTGRAVSESAVSHSLLRMSREKPGLVARVRRGRYVGLAHN